ncbi:hypothetical protein L6164_000706 [Bauhinia variegata]|uniref:Uncharacterized protein n=1 Tax=Bauhinia variegata TaxID=167791 RepID=A0ACB9Q7F9_BAUVA|nr:hypothetical protein L6164_000706 [Bauhinia variegata]
MEGRERNQSPHYLLSPLTACSLLARSPAPSFHQYISLLLPTSSNPLPSLSLFSSESREPEISRETHTSERPVPNLVLAKSQFISLSEEMDMYGSLSTPDCFRIDDLLDFSNDDFAAATTSSSSSSTGSLDYKQDHPPPQNPFTQYNHYSSSQPLFDNFPCVPSSTDFTTSLCVLSDDAAELEWLSRFVDDSFHEFPENDTLGLAGLRPDTSFPSKARSKRSKALVSSPSKPTREQNEGSSATTGEGGVRRCTHCASEKTPQWRTGPLGPKTLCNACGVRYKSGRLVPEYRPAASPTFVLTQHSNSHRKVMELRRQKELMRQQQPTQQPEQCYHH